MKNLSIPIGLFFILLTAFTCDDNLVLPCENNDWLSQQVSTMKRNKSVKGLIEQYEYNDQIVLSMTSCVNCSDAMTVVFDCSGNELCKFGGIAGYNTCPDFSTQAKLVRVIFKS